MNDIQKSLPATEDTTATIANTENDIIANTAKEDNEKQFVPLLEPKSKSQLVNPVITKQPILKKNKRKASPTHDPDMAMSCCQCLECCGEVVNNCLMVVCCCWVLHST